MPHSQRTHLCRGWRYGRQESSPGNEGVRGMVNQTVPVPETTTDQVGEDLESSLSTEEEAAEREQLLCSPV